MKLQQPQQMFQRLIPLAALFTSAAAQDYLCSTSGDGTGTAVPAGDMWDGAAVVTAVCRDANTGCDAPESCDGVATDCPTDTFAASSVEARAATTACDVAEMCSGTDDVIAADVFALSSVEARAATTACDVAEMCSGTDDVIAADVSGCEYSWQPNAFGNCPTLCGASESVQTRLVICQDSAGGTVDPLNCDAGSEPTSSEVCAATAACLEYAWAAAAWPACADACGSAESTQTRVVTCREYYLLGSTAVSSTFCTGPKPAESNACAPTVACVTYSWDAAAFPACPTACGAAETTQSRAVACLGSDGSPAAALPEAACAGEVPAGSRACPAAAACGTAAVRLVSAATYDDIGMGSLAEPAARAQFEGDFRAAVVAALPSLALAEADVAVDSIEAKAAEGGARRLAGFKLRRLAEASGGVVVAFSIAVPAAGAAAAEAAFVEALVEGGGASALAVEHEGALVLPAAVAQPAVVEVEQQPAPGPDGPGPKTTSGAEGTSLLLASLLAAALAHAL